MANYTYEQFQKAAQDAGMWDKFSDADRRLAQSNPDAGMSLLGYKKDYAGATSEQGRLLANAGANGIRKQYGGYTGGSDGSGYALTGEGNGSFNSAANEQANAMLALLEKREPYSYDAKNDPAAQSYRKQYAREGQRATKDTMGTYAAMTGGTPSTAAVTAAQQAGNYYAAQSADKVGELEQMAYQRYQNEGDQMRQTWSMYRDQADAEYSRWLNEKNLQTQAEQLEYERAWQQEQLEYERAQAEYQRKYNEAVLAAQYGDYSGLRELGIDPNVYASGGYSYGGGGSGSGSGSGSDDDEDDEDETKQPVGLPDDVYNSLTTAYPDKIVPEAGWPALVERYGEDALTAEGFKKAERTPVVDPNDENEGGGYVYTPSSPARNPNLPARPGISTGAADYGRGAAASAISDGDMELLTNRADADGRVPAYLYDKTVNKYGEAAVKAAGFSRGD